MPARRARARRCRAPAAVRGRAPRCSGGRPTAACRRGRAARRSRATSAAPGRRPPQGRGGRRCSGERKHARTGALRTPARTSRRGTSTTGLPRTLRGQSSRRSCRDPAGAGRAREEAPPCRLAGSPGRARQSERHHRPRLGDSLHRTSAHPPVGTHSVHARPDSLEGVVQRPSPLLPRPRPPAPRARPPPCPPESPGAGVPLPHSRGRAPRCASLRKPRSFAHHPPMPQRRPRPRARTSPPA